MKREVMMVLAAGVGKPEDIDLLFRYCFQAKGAPCQLMDNVGLQTVCNIEEYFIDERGNIPGYPVDFIRKEYVEKGNTGTNTGKGLFDHTAEKKSDGGGEGSFREQIIGAWELLDYHAYVESDPSDKIYPMGRNCQGIIMYTPDGYMSAHLQIPGRPPFAKNDLSGGTEIECTEAGRNYLAYTGPFYLDESGYRPSMKHHMTDCSFPKWLGNTQERLVKITEEKRDKNLNLAPDGAIEVSGEKKSSRIEVATAS